MDLFEFENLVKAYADEEARAHGKYTELADHAQAIGLSYTISDRITTMALEEGAHSIYLGELHDKLTSTIRGIVAEEVGPRQARERAEEVLGGMEGMGLGKPDPTKLYVLYQTSTNLNTLLPVQDELRLDGHYGYIDFAGGVYALYVEDPQGRPQSSSMGGIEERGNPNGWMMSQEEAEGLGMGGMHRQMTGEGEKSGRPFPQTYSDWVDLAEDIKQKMPPEAWGYSERIAAGHIARGRTCSRRG